MFRKSGFEIVQFAARHKDQLAAAAFDCLSASIDIGRRAPIRGDGAVIIGGKGDEEHGGLAGFPT